MKSFKRYLMEGITTFDNMDTLPLSLEKWDDVDEMTSNDEDFESYIYSFVNDFEGYFPYGQHLDFNNLNDDVLKMMMGDDKYKGDVDDYREHLNDTYTDRKDIVSKFEEMLELLYDDNELDPFSYDYFKTFIGYYFEGLLMIYKEEMEDTIQDGKIPIYRAITIRNNKLSEIPKDPNRSIGICWTYDYDILSSIMSGITGWGTPEKPLIILESAINTSMVNWETTQALILEHPSIYEEEREIRLFDKTPLIITNILDVDMKPMDKYQKYLPFKIKS